MNRKFRLAKSTDIKRVRRLGNSHAHPLIVLISHPNELRITRFGILTGRTLGNAYHRNRSKRKIREVIRPLINAIRPGWDIILLARQPITSAKFSDIRSAILFLLDQAELLK